MKLQKNANSREELISIIEELDSEDFTSYQIKKSSGTYVVEALKETTLEEIENQINAYINKQRRYGARLISTRAEEDEDTVSFELTLPGNYNLPWGKQYRLGNIHCYLNETKTEVVDLRLSLYTDIIPKEKLVELKKQYDCFEAWGIGSPPLYHVYVYNFNDLNSIFKALDSLTHPKE